MRKGVVNPHRTGAPVAGVGHRSSVISILATYRFGQVLPGNAHAPFLSSRLNVYFGHPEQPFLERFGVGEGTQRLYAAPDLVEDALVG